MVVCRTAAVRPVRLSASVDGMQLTNYVADGLIAATPTGSTAYALAAGGPILPPELRNILLVPIAPHLSVDRAVVLSEGSSVSITLRGGDAVLSVDGQTPVGLAEGGCRRRARRGICRPFRALRRSRVLLPQPDRPHEPESFGRFSPMIDLNAPTYCANHPGVETTLRCNKCGKPICAKCAIRTPTGYRCKECVRGQLKIFDTALWYDYVLGFITAGVLGFLASLLALFVSGLSFIGWILIIIGAPTAGVVIAEGVRLVIKKRRSRALFITIAVAMVLGALPVIIVNLISLNLFGLIFQGIFLFIATPVVYTRLSGIQLNR